MGVHAKRFVSASGRGWPSLSKLLAGLLAVATVVAAFTGSALARRRTSARRPAASIESPAPSALSDPYTSACVIEPTTRTVIFDQDMHKPWPMASVTKMMLALIVAEKIQDGSLKLTDMVTASRKAEEMGGSQVYLKEGESFSLDDMMKAIVVHSANDASVAVAEYVGGSTAAFVQMMNQQAAALGLKDTHYYSVHGLPPDRGQNADVSSAYDLAILASESVKYPDILRWSSIDTAPFRNGTFQLRNTNHLVRTYSGCDGLKTGFYDKAGFNVMATAKRNGLRLIAVVLGSPRKEENFSSAATLLSEGFANYQIYPIAKKGAPIPRTVAVSGGAAGSVAPVWGEDVNVFAKRGDGSNAYTIDYRIAATVVAPVAAGQRLGLATVSMAGRTVAQEPIVAGTAVTRGSLTQRLFGWL